MLYYALLDPQKKTVIERIDWIWDNVTSKPAHSIKDTYSKELSDRLIACPSHVTEGYTYTAPDTWTAPVVDTTPPEVEQPNIPTTPDFDKEADASQFPFTTHDFSWVDFLRLFTPYELEYILKCHQTVVGATTVGSPWASAAAWQMLEKTLAGGTFKIWNPMVLAFLQSQTFTLMITDTYGRKEFNKKVFTTVNNAVLFRTTQILTGTPPHSVWFSGDAETGAMQSAGITDCWKNLIHVGIDMEKPLNVALQSYAVAMQMDEPVDMTVEKLTEDPAL